MKKSLRRTRTRTRTRTCIKSKKRIRLRIQRKRIERKIAKLSRGRERSKGSERVSHATSRHREGEG